MVILVSSVVIWVSSVVTLVSSGIIWVSLCVILASSKVISFRRWLYDCLREYTGFNMRLLGGYMGYFGGSIDFLYG